MGIGTTNGTNLTNGKYELATTPLCITISDFPESETTRVKPLSGSSTGWPDAPSPQ